MDNIMLKKCSKCGIEKKNSEDIFRLDKARGRLKAMCRECENKRNIIGKYPYKCMNCGKNYLAKFKSRNKFCTRKCAYDFKSINAKGKEVQDKIIIKCCVCGNEFEGFRDYKCCSKSCREEYNSLRALYNAIIKHIPGRYTCKACGNIFSTEYGDKSRGIYCSDECSRKYNRRVAKALRRARIKGNEYESIDPISIFIRDEWICQMCGVRTPYELRGTWEDDAPELDHAVPLALGGTHTIDNVQCSCRKCNQSKGAKLFVE